LAELLYRLGRFSARHAWTVLLSWLAILALAVGAFLIAGGTLSSSVPIPGTETARVTDKLTESFPSASGGTGSMVFHTEDGSEFSSEQKRTISELLESAGGLAGVDTTTDPFQTAREISDQEQQITDGEEQISDGRDQLSSAQEQLDAAAEQLDAAQTPLDTELQRAQQAGDLPDAVQAQFDTQQQQIDAQRTELDTQQTDLSEQLSDLDEQAKTLDLSSRLLEMSARSGTVPEDDTTALATVVFDAAQDDVTPETKAAVTDHISGGLPDGVSVEFATELDSSCTEIFGAGEIVGLAVAALTLLIMLGTVIAAALPLVTAIVGVGIGVTASLAMSGVVEMISLTPVLGVMLGLAVGIDYALFILNRHRRQLLEGTELHESIGLANGTSGNAVVFAGSTVLIALLALNVTGIGFLGMMGTVGAICVAIAILLAITAAPALLALLGTRVLTRKNRARSRHCITQSEHYSQVGSVQSAFASELVVLDVLDDRVVSRGMETTADTENIAPFVWGAAGSAIDQNAVGRGIGVADPVDVVVVDDVVHESDVALDACPVGDALEDFDRGISAIHRFPRVGGDHIGQGLLREQHHRDGDRDGRAVPSVGAQPSPFAGGCTLDAVDDDGERDGHEHGAVVPGWPPVTRVGRQEPPGERRKKDEGER
jgi:uncharacterized membrane protein YdfJ with MMPL/SSD domain